MNWTANHREQKNEVTARLLVIEAALGFHPTLVCASEQQATRIFERATMIAQEMYAAGRSTGPPDG